MVHNYPSIHHIPNALIPAMCRYCCNSKKPCNRCLEGRIRILQEEKREQLLLNEIARREAELGYGEWSWFIEGDPDSAGGRIRATSENESIGLAYTEFVRRHPNSKVVKIHAKRFR